MTILYYFPYNINMWKTGSIALFFVGKYLTLPLL